MTLNPFRNGIAILGAAVVAALGSCYVQAADRVWNDSAADFNSAGSWTGGLPGTGDAAVFPADEVIQFQPNLTADISIQQVRFIAPTAAGYTLGADPGAALRLNNTGTGISSALVGAHFTGVNTFTAPIVLGAAAAATQTFNMIGGGTTFISGNIAEFNAGIKLRVEGQATGVLRLSGSNSFTGGLILNGGTLLLDYATYSTVVNSANPLTLGGGTLELRAKSGDASAQTLENITLTQFTASKIILDPNGGSLALTLGNTWTAGTPSALYLALPAGTEISSAPTLINGLLPYAVLQDDSGIGFATASAGKLVHYSHTPAEQLTATPPFNSTANLWHSGDLTVTSGSRFGQTLSVDTTGGGELNFSGNTHNVVGSVLFHGTGSFVITNGGFQAGSSAGNLLVQQYAEGIVTLATDVGAGHLNKTGPGALVLTGTNTTARALRIYEGMVRIDNASWLNGDATTLNGGVLELGAVGNLTNTVGSSTTASHIRWLGDGGFSAHGATREVRLNDSTASIDWGSASFVPANSALLFSSQHANTLLDFRNGLGLGTVLRVVRVANGSAPVDARLSGVLSGAGGGLIKEGAGTLELTADNDYTGETWVKVGALRISGNQAAATGRTTVLGDAILGGSGTIGGDVTLGSGGALKPHDTGGAIPSKLTIVGAFDLEDGTLDLTGLEALAPGAHVLAEFASKVGDAFAAVTGNSLGATITYTATQIILARPSGTVIMLR